MKILVTVERSPKYIFLVDLRDKKVLERLRAFLENKNYPKAVDAAITKGKFLGEVSPEEFPHIDAKLILNEKNAHFDLIEK